ncbi:Reticulon-like protein [Quillaja saponaria]|uniref:Reticulon-like protein n=1 Tax=Quillaja saponaria TaxID=32244 RepID=A0AAD7KWZ0_QUISA|nr:Reticulon-like protein [Quillaja saponaria]
MAVDDRFAELNPRTCVVLGGRGFLGRSLVLRLLKLGKYIVRIADSTQSFELDPSERESLLSHAISSGRASYFNVDVRDKTQIVKAIEGSSAVFYLDPTDLNTNDFCSCYLIIVQGAKNVINACRECRVKRLIYNSSADVVFDGSHDIHSGDESLACPSKFEKILSDFKAQAEALILFANDIDGLLTCALRPSNIFGPGDSELVPLLVKLAKSGLGKFIIGNGDNMSDFTFSENVSYAHICAEEALDLRNAIVAGKAFFITNLVPMKFWEFVSLISEGLGYQRPLTKIPARMAWYVFLLFKWTHEKLASGSSNFSELAHYIQLASCTRTFNCVAAQRNIGYSPVVTLEDGVALTIESFSHLASDLPLARYSDFTEESKAHKLLGGGKVADILLWRDEKTTFKCFLALIVLFYWFCLGGNTFTSSAAKLLLLVTVILYGYGFLPSNIFGFSVEMMSFPSQISDTVAKDSVATIVYLWSLGVQNIRTLAQGEEWSMFFKVTVSLYFLKIVAQSFTVMIGMALAFAFTAIFFYEQYESEIDGSVKVLFNILKEIMALLTRNLPDSVSLLLCNHETFQPDDRPAGVKQTR